MILFPYRAQIRLHRIPVVTIAVALVCLLVYLLQARSDARVEAHAQAVCQRLEAAGEGGGDYRFGPWRLSCADMVLHIHYDPDPERHLDWHVRYLEAKGNGAAAERLRTQYRTFAERAPRSLTARLWHDRSRFDPVGMITSSFAHGSWDHVTFNLMFFFAFAAAVELVVGPVLFIGMILLLSLGIGVFDHFIAHWQGDPVPSLGLSGVVMGMLALFVYFLPRAKIRFFFWFMLSVGTVGIPAWSVAIWYLGWDLFYQLVQVRSGTNYVAHLAGGALGFALGVALFRQKRHWARELVLEKVDLTQEESWLSKFNGLMVGPAIAGFAVLAGVFLLLVFIAFVQRYWPVLLMALPAAAGAWYAQRLRRAARPTGEHYREAAAHFERGHEQKGAAALEKLAHQGYSRAQFDLAQLYAGGLGVLRDEQKAAHWLRAAAQRDHAQAAYQLGARYADGRGLTRDLAEAIRWYEKAAGLGVGEAASSLGYLYEHGAQGMPADRERAMEWYYRAGVAFKKAGRIDDARAMLQALEAMARDYPAVLGMVARLNGILAVQAGPT